MTYQPHISERGTPTPSKSSASDSSTKIESVDSSIDETDFIEPEHDFWVVRTGRTSTRAKLTAGFRGLKNALRDDSSFFAHSYRGVLIAASAIILRVPPVSWCFLVASAAIILVAELSHSAFNALVCATQNLDDPRIKSASEVSAAGVLVASITSAIITMTVLLTRLSDLLGW